MKTVIIYVSVLMVFNYKVLTVPLTQTTAAQDDDDDEWDEDEESSEVDDDGRVYKNPRNSPSTDCPRDEEQATLLGQKCLRKCSSDEDCKSKKKRCLCDGACGMSCIKPDRECPELAQPSLGLIAVEGRHFGERASYSCPNGYHVVGLQSRLCQADGNWAGAEPACKQNIYCSKPPKIEHARNSALPEQETFDLDSTVQYHCYNGYVTNGFPRAKCLAIDGQASWYGPDIQCEPRTCGQPPDPANGWHSGECYTFGCKISYNCGSGYELVGKHDRTCQSDGSWTPKELPSCVLVTSVVCPSPENPKNGKATFTTLAYNSVVSYECRYGYTLVGESSSRCGADRKWSGVLPNCKEINCGHPGNIYNGWIENIEAGTGLGASIIFRCHSEMLMKGYSSSVCQIDGRWRNGIPECLAPCIVPAISQGYVVPVEVVTDENGTTVALSTQQSSFSSTSVEKVQHGTSLDVKCDLNYEFPASLMNPPTCHNGTWSIIPRCVPARCKNMPKPPKHGMVLAPKTEHGMKARIKCKDGFKLVNSEGKDVVDVNNNVLSCSFGNWTGDTPHCQEVFCSFPGYIPHGKVLLVGNMGLYDYRPYVKKIVNNKQIMYDCDKGYVLDVGPPGATCVGGKWRPLELPQCALGQHPRLRWNRRRRSVEIRHVHSSYLSKHLRTLQRMNMNSAPALKYNTNKIVEIKENDGLKELKMEQVDFKEAYSKYYQRIKQKYQDFVMYLLGNKCAKHFNDDQPHPAKFKVHNVRLNYNTSKLPQAKTSAPENGTIFNVIYSNSIYQAEDQSNTAMDQNSNMRGDDKEMALNNKERRTNDFIEKLKDQITRRRQKRNMDHSILIESDKMGIMDAKETKKRIRSPCEELDWDSFANISIKRAGKSSDLNSIGSVVGLECNPGFQLNIKNVNSTVRCIKGNWKPEKPKCIPAPCIVPFVDNGKYYSVGPQATGAASTLANQLPLATYAEIDSNEFIALECEDGFRIQGATRMRCSHGSWSVNAFSSCASVACNLPNIPGIIYEGGYRAGLKIAHGSSVNVRCNYSINTQSIELVCNKGAIEPDDIHCESGMRKSREEVLSGVEVGERMRNIANLSDNLDPLNTTDVIEDLKMCGPPSISDSALIYRNSDMDIEGVYESGTEIYFNCIPSASGERNTWKIMCENGQWIGRSYNCANGTCLFKNNEPNVVSFYNDLEIREDIVEFPPGATITSRCVDIGKFELVGSIERRCIHSEWTGTKPQCFGLNQENDYAMEKAPTILFRRQNGPIAQSNDGKLIVFPGTTLHMECLWMRRFGNPKWSVSHNIKNYTEGWVTEEGRDTNLEYRLSLVDAVTEDSGIFSCETPARHKHSVEIVVKTINCPEIPTRRGLIVSTNDTKLSTRILLSCSNGNSLIGSSELFCLPSGNWSSPLPVCESVECGDIPLPNNSSSPQVSVLSREVGGRAAFSCPSGYGLRGPSESICMPSGEWATPFPTCVEVQCEDPGAPENGYAQGTSPYRSSDVIQFNCNPEYMMQGQPIIACQENGRWSGGLPKCVQACSYPGTAISGHMSSVQFYYAIGESITFTCDAGLDLRGPKMVKCLKNGKWSGAIPQCISPE